MFLKSSKQSSKIQELTNLLLRIISDDRTVYSVEFTPSGRGPPSKATWAGFNEELKIRIYRGDSYWSIRGVQISEEWFSLDIGVFDRRSKGFRVLEKLAEKPQTELRKASQARSDAYYEKIIEKLKKVLEK